MVWMKKRYHQFCIIYISLALGRIVTAGETDAAVEAMKISLGYCRYLTASRVLCRNAV